MGAAMHWTVTAKGASKADAGALFLEFWTSKGFREHQASYNRIVLRRNGYGTLRSWIDSAIGETGHWYQAPMELTVHVQVRPDHTKYEMQFVLGAGWHELESGDLEEFTGAEVDEFISFIDDWMAHGTRELEN